MYQQQGNSFLITEENLKPIIQKYFDRLTPAQWTMIMAEEWDPNIQSTLADMISEIIQTVSADILRVVLPMVQRGTAAAAPVENIKPQLGDALPKSFSQLLHVPLDRCEDAHELTEMIEQEIEEKVSSRISAATNTEVLPSQPAVYVTGFVSNVKRLGCMVFHAARCLKANLVKMSFRCRGTDAAGKHTLDVPLAVEGVTDILMKWSTGSPNVTSEDESVIMLPVVSLTETKRAATKIVNILTKNLKKRKSVISTRSKKISSPTFDMGSVVGEVKHFFLSHAPCSEDRQYQFLHFARKQFEMMSSELRNEFETKRQKFVLNIKSTSSSLLLQDYYYILPGSVPENTKSDNLLLQKTKLHVRKDEYCLINFDTIKSDVTNLFRAIEDSNKPEELSFQDIPTSIHVQRFAEELKYKLYSYWTPYAIYKQPLCMLGKSMSDSVICKVESTLGEGESDIPPEVMIAIIEDAVEKFLEQVLLWVMKPEITHGEKVTGALTDMENLFTNMLNPPEEVVVEVVKTETSSAPAVDAGSHLHDVVELDNQDDEQNKTEIQILTADNVAPRSPDTPSPEETSSSPEETSLSPEETSSSPKSTEESTPEAVLQEKSADSSLSNPQSLSEQLVAALLLRLISKYSKEKRPTLQIQEINATFERLLHVVIPEMDAEDPKHQIAEENIKDLAYVLSKDLLKTFGSATNLLQAAMASDDPCFDNALLICLKYQLQIKIKPRKRNILARFFSSVQKCTEKFIMFYCINIPSDSYISPSPAFI